MTKAVCSEDAIKVSHEAKPTFEEKIANRKTIVYETLVDPAVIRIAAENLKDQLFTRYGFLRPAPDDVALVCVEKSYEPFIIITGRYAIDYYRKRTFTFNVDSAVSEVVFGFGRFSSNLPYIHGRTQKVVEISGEERLQNETKADLTLDVSGKEVSLKQLPSAPSEKKPEKIVKKLGEKQVPPEFDLDILRSRIQKRPADVSWIQSESFEVTERVVIYTPRFRALYKNSRTGKERAAEFDGVTGKLVRVGDS